MLSERYKFSNRDRANVQPQGELQAAAAPPVVPTEVTVEASPMPSRTSTTISIGTATEEPDTTETPIVFNTIVVRPTRTSRPTATGIPTAVFTAIAATHIAFATNVAAHREEIQTSVAMTHAPTITPGRPPAYPSPTPIMGMLPGCSNISPNGPQAVNCWRGVVDGEVVQVYAGREGRDGDQLQGIIWMHVQGQDGDDDIYQTPQRVGAVGIASVSSRRFTLQTVGQSTPQLFVFDLDTKQWVSP